MIISFFFRKAKDSCGRDVWLTNGTYWKLRENPGFANTENIILWWGQQTKLRDKTMRERWKKYQLWIFGQHIWTALGIISRAEIVLISSHPFCTPMTGSWEPSWPLSPTRKSPVKVSSMHYSQVKKNRTTTLIKRHFLMHFIIIFFRWL